MYKCTNSMPKQSRIYAFRDRAMVDNGKQFLTHVTIVSF